MKFKGKFITSFIFIMICTHFILFIVSNILNSIVFNLKEWEGASFIIPSTLVICILLILDIYISTILSLKISVDKNIKEDYQNLGRFISIFFIILVVINLLYQFIFYQSNFDKSLNNINTFKDLLTGDNTIFNEAKKVFLIMNIITAVLSNSFILLMIPISKKKITRVKKES